ncbi:MAG: hypothetical protein MK089_09950 [Phycisphaerales bacterium]|nr:hypothetical protein [Phycisphaerales bacterium]
MAPPRSTRTKKPAKFQFDGSARALVLVCKDSFLRSHYTNEVVQQLESIHGEIDRFDFDGEDASPGDVLEELQAVGLLHTHKLIIVDKADRFMTGSPQSKGPSAARQLLEKYVQAPSEGATLLMRAETWHAGKLDKLIDVFKVSVEHEDAASNWCQQRATKAYDVPIEPAAADLLVRRVGLDLGRLDGELNKLAAIVGDRNSITEKDVREAVGASREEEAWAIKAAIVLDGPEQSLQTIREIFDLSSSTRKDVPAFWAIIDLLRGLHAASCLLKQGLRGWDAQQAAGIFDRRSDRKTAQQIMAFAQAIDPDEAALLLRQALELQTNLRRGIGDPRHALEGLTVVLADRLQSLRAA